MILQPYSRSCVFRNILINRYFSVSSIVSSKEKQIAPCKPSDADVCKIDPCVLDPCMPEPAVVIIGAGIAGLSAANRLVHCGVRNIKVLEATERPGGRIHSCWLGDVVAELGSQWIYGGCMANPVFTLAAQEGLLKPPLFRPDPTRGMFFTTEGRAIDMPVSITAYHTFKQIEREAASLFCMGTGRQHGSLLHFLAQRMQQEILNFPELQREDAKRVMIGMACGLRCRCGDDLSLISANNFGSYIDIPGGQVRVPLGLIGLLAPLLRDLPDNCVRYCKPVQNVRWGATGGGGDNTRAVVTCVDGDCFKADFVLVTVPLGFLKEHAETFFCPALPAHKMDAICKLGFGNLNKIFLEYRRPFWSWREGSMRLAWSEDDLSGCDPCDWTTGLAKVEELPSSTHVMCAWVSGKEAAHMERCADEHVAEDITRTLRKFTGDPSLPYPDNVLRSRWHSDPYFRGAYSYLGLQSSVQHLKDLGEPLPGPCDPCPPVLLFAGEATIPGHNATMHGARLTGIKEADRILNITRMHGGPPKNS